MMVSVCMATYNGEKYIKEQIESILSQLHPEDELVISDDGSTDGTLETIRLFKDDRIRILNSNTKNIIKNFENALSNAKGDILFLADQDDIWHPSKVEESIKHLENYDLVFSNLEVFTDNILNTKLFYQGKKGRTGVLRNIIKNNYIGATMAFKRKVLVRALPFPKGIYMHDIWLAMVAELIGKTFFINTPLIYYRRHDENASETGEKSSNPFSKKMTIRFLLVFNLVKRFL